MRRDRFNIVLYKGESFALVVELDDNTGAAVNLTSATITAQCKVKSTNTTLFSFTTATTSGLTPQKGLVYDVKIAWSGGDTKYWLGGEV